MPDAPYFDALRTVWKARLEALAAQWPEQPQSWPHRGFLSYLRHYVHPQATWADARTLLAKASAISLTSSALQHPLPWACWPEAQSQALPPEQAFLLHRRWPAALPQRPEAEAAWLARQLQALFPEGRPLRALFASAYDAPLFRALLPQRPLQLQCPALPDAAALSGTLPFPQASVHWSQPLLEAPAPGSLFGDGPAWEEALPSWERTPPDLAWVNACLCPSERFERGNQRLHAADAPRAEAFGLESLPMPLRLLACALQAQRPVAALLPKPFVLDPAWRQWRQALLRQAAVQVAVPPAAVPWALVCFWPGNPRPSRWSAWAQGWPASVHWQPLGHTDGHWHGPSAFWEARPLWPSGSGKAWGSVFFRADVPAAGWPPEAETAAEAGDRLRALLPGVSRRMPALPDVPDAEGIYLAQQPYRARPFPHPAVAGALGPCEVAHWWPRAALSAEAVKAARRHYALLCPLPQGMPDEAAAGFLEQLQRFSRALPVLHKYTERLEALATAYRADGAIRFEAGPELEAMLEQYGQKIEQLARGARERKGAFEQLQGALEGWKLAWAQALHDRQALQDRLEAIDEASVWHYACGVLRSEGYARRYAEALAHAVPRLPLLPDFWAWAQWGRDMALHDAQPGQALWEARWQENRWAALPLMRLDRERRCLQVDEALRLDALPEAWLEQGSPENRAFRRMLQAFQKRWLRLDACPWAHYREQLLQGLLGLAKPPAPPEPAWPEGF